MNEEKAVNILEKRLKKKREVIEFWESNTELHTTNIKKYIEQIKEEVKAYEMAIKSLKEEWPKGKWIIKDIETDRPTESIKCSNCGRHFDVWFIDEGTNLCSNCGADLRESEE